MIRKQKVSQFARERKVNSADVLAKLAELDEYVKNSAATIEPPVIRKLEKFFPLPKKTANAEAGSQPAQPSSAAKIPMPENLKRQTRQVFEQERKKRAEDEAKRKTPSSIPLPHLRGGNNPYMLASRLQKLREQSGTNQTLSPDARRGLKRPAGAVKEGRAGGSAEAKPGQTVARPQPAKQPGFSGYRGRSGRGAAQRGQTQGAFGRSGANWKAKKTPSSKYDETESLETRVIGGIEIAHGGGRVITLFPGATLMDLADKISVDPAQLVLVLFKLGEVATATQSLDADTFRLLGAELGYEIAFASVEEEDREILRQFDIGAAEETDPDSPDLVVRPPVVTVMGHVDHGKTKLLDSIRNTNVLATEAGGITQRIGAYQVEVDLAGQTRLITFIDTPGHEAFTAMRARGAEVTDIAVLVVAADDGVMPQTVEALNHAKAAGAPIVVAINKIDLPGADPTKVRGQLAEMGLLDEAYGGDTIFVEISAKQNLHIDKLLEAIILTADAALELKANPKRSASGSVIEARLDRGRGANVTGLVRDGTLKIGDSIVAGTSYGRVRALTDEHGHDLTFAGPSRPVIVLGLTSVPLAGDSLLVVPEERIARQITEKREATQRAADLARRRSRITLEEFSEAVSQSKLDTLSLIIKGDTSGSVEALENALMTLDIPEELRLNIIHRAVGDVTQNDINLASIDQAIIIAFNVKTQIQVAKFAEAAGVTIKDYNVIYAVSEDIEQALKGMLKPIYQEFEAGRGEVMEIFSSSKFGEIAGCLVRKGTVRRNSKVSVERQEQLIAQNLVVESLRRFKDDVTEVKEGFECGVGLQGFSGLEVGDYILVMERREVPRT